MVNMRTGAQLLVDALVTNGVERVFGVPGESYLAVLDALYDASADIRFITCRQEGGAAYMAEAQGKMTGRPGICMVTRGPGATNASVGLHTAFQDSTPMILFVGQVARDMTDREAFQEVDYRRMFGQLAKWVAQIDDAARVPEYVSRAFHVAQSGRPGPVVLALPEDMLSDRAPPVDIMPAVPAQAAPPAASIERVGAMLSAAKRPMVVVGGSTWTAQAVSDLAAFAAANDLPVASAFRAMDLMDNRDPHYVGQCGLGADPAMERRLGEADLVIALGDRLGEITTAGYTRLAVLRPAQTLIHVHPGAEELNSVYQADLAILSAMPAAMAALARMAPVDGARWQDWTASARADYQAFSARVDLPGPLNMSDVLGHLAASLPDDAVIANGAGNYAAFVGRFYRYRSYRTLLAPASGSMGYGVPSAVAAKLAYPDRTVISINGDGCFLMNGQEMATAVQHGANVIFLVVNNGMYGTIRMHQEREYPGRVSGTDLKNPDFVTLAKGYGAGAEQVTQTEAFPAALDRALSAGEPYLIELVVDPEALTPAKTLSQIRAAAQKARKD